jgi:hypothetical protein
MALNVQLEGTLWCVYQDGEKVFSHDFRRVEEWLDQVEIASKHCEPSAGAEPQSAFPNRLPARFRIGNAAVTSSKP